MRTQIAEAENIPTYWVFADKTLKELSEVMPQSEAEMLQVFGVGPKKFESYGQEFLAAIKKFNDDPDKYTA